MAEERDDSQRTEEPTQKRLDDAHKKGDVVRSTELATFIMLSGGTLAILVAGSAAARAFLGNFLLFLERPDQITLDSGGAVQLLSHSIYGLFAIIGPAALLLMGAALAGQLLQHRPGFSPERIAPDLGKLSPLKGFKRLFGLDGLANLIKGILKISAVSLAAYLVLWPERARLATVVSMDPAGLIGFLFALTFKLLIAALLVVAAIAAADYIYQRQRFQARHRMSRQELKDEIKQSEGDPQIKARIRQVRQERARRRMMAAIPKATVVITNPTHYAVALRYESGKMGAPVCVAKGTDQLALRIREVAEEHAVPIVENPPLARALYAGVELDAEIPPEHYKAVAGIISYVMRLAKERAFWRNGRA
jgi:flagellar biosynthetic protein FlhB